MFAAYLHHFDMLSVFASAYIVLSMCEGKFNNLLNNHLGENIYVTSEGLSVRKFNSIK